MGFLSAILISVLIGAGLGFLVIPRLAQQRQPGSGPSPGKRAEAPGATAQTGSATAGSQNAQPKEISVDPTFTQNFGVLTTVAERGPISLDIRTVGILVYNSKNLATISPKFEGWIENAPVIYIGQPVAKGQVLFEVYSPELVATQNEYLIALKGVAQSEKAGSPDFLQQSKSLLSAAEERLRLWDISPDQIAQLSKTGRASRTMKVLSPVSGIITAKLSDSLEGARVAPGTNVYTIADLSSLWVQVQVFEYQLTHLHIGQTAHIALDAFPGRHWEGRIVYLDPTLNPQTRTLTAKVEIPNPDLRLRPDMYANVEINVPLITALRVPEQAILHTGERNVIIVQKPEGRFEPRNIVTGVSGGGYTEVLRGLRPGEKVVTSSQFLIDSESNLQQALGAMASMSGMGPPGGTQPKGQPPGGAQTPPGQQGKQPPKMPPMPGTPKRK